MSKCVRLSVKTHLECYFLWQQKNLPQSTHAVGHTERKHSKYVQSRGVLPHHLLPTPMEKENQRGIDRISRNYWTICYIRGHHFILFSQEKRKSHGRQIKERKFDISIHRSTNRKNAAPFSISWEIFSLSCLFPYAFIRRFDANADMIRVVPYLL